MNTRILPLTTIFQRHANPLKACAGDDDLKRPLSKLGHKQAMYVSDELQHIGRGFNPKAGLGLYSPATRCAQTILGHSSEHGLVSVPELHFTPVPNETDDERMRELLEEDARIIEHLFLKVLGYAPLASYLAMPRVAAGYERRNMRTRAAIDLLLERAAKMGATHAHIVGHAGSLTHLAASYLEPGSPAWQIMMHYSIGEAEAIVISPEGNLIAIVTPNG